MKINGTNQLLAYADVNLLGNNIDTTKKNTESVTDCSKKVGLEINTEKTECMLLSRHQNAGQNRDIKMSQFIYLGTAAADQNMIEFWQCLLPSTHTRQLLFYGGLI
jgi:hypothetical protein